ncbi:MAG: mercury methylation ferredoxin HgcB [bacterium]
MIYLKNVVTLRFDESRCTGCKRCTEVCPHAVFVMTGKKAQLVERDRCIECGACQNNCEFEAITVTAGVGCAAAIIYGMITGTEPQCGCPPEGSQNSSGCC